MTPRLTEISVSDFRSIKGEISIPLDAPIVLVHGPNGAGKTSLMSALELALTGEVGALRRTDPDIHQHLTHRAASSAHVKLSAEGLPTPSASFEIVAGIIRGEPLLPPALRQFYTERCYLSQLTLSRLLEIYQSPTSRDQRDTPLTRFVKDLLGLDQLEALIDGLHDAGHKRRLFRLAPDLERAEQVAANLAGEESQSAADASTDAARRKELQAKFAELSADLGFSPSQADEDVEKALRNRLEEETLTQLTSRRRELLSLTEGWEALPQGADGDARERIEAAEAQSAAELETFEEGPGRALSQVAAGLRSLFPDLPDPAQVDPQEAWQTALDRTERELSRCETALALGQRTGKKLATTDQNIRQLQVRIQTLDAQIKEFPGDASSFGQALAGILPHVHGPDCPVCGRDYSEVSHEPLTARVTAEISRLVADAERLTSFVQERNEASGALAAAERNRSTQAGQALAQPVQTQLQQRAATLREAQLELQRLEKEANRGGALRRRRAKAAAAAARLRLRDTRMSEIRAALAGLAEELRQPAPTDAETTPDALARMLAFVDKEYEAAELRAAHRRDALTVYLELRALEESDRKRSTAAEHRSAKATSIKEALRQAGQIKKAAWAISRAAKQSRSSIVGRVFNKQLNTIWRDLFVRLAPSEPFIPAFTLPQDDKAPVEVTLETVHREGGRYGRPGAMLSAGNLNTAALTLFTALHLAVRPKLPWLLLDDPVQTMDELHIAQFAALLRTLAKSEGRQVILTVHERPLFEYLALELSPAFPGDKLITIELARSPKGETRYTPVVLSYEPDKLVA